MHSGCNRTSLGGYNAQGGRRVRLEPGDYIHHTRVPCVHVARLVRHGHLVAWAIAVLLCFCIFNNLTHHLVVHLCAPLTICVAHILNTLLLAHLFFYRHSKSRPGGNSKRCLVCRVNTRITSLVCIQKGNELVAIAPRVLLSITRRNRYSHGIGTSMEQEARNGIMPSFACELQTRCSILARSIDIGTSKDK